MREYLNQTIKEFAILVRQTETLGETERILEAFSKVIEDACRDIPLVQDGAAASLGRAGGAATKARLGIEHYENMGKKGGATTAAKYGAEHYTRISKMGLEAKQRKKKGA